MSVSAARAERGSASPSTHRKMYPIARQKGPLGQETRRIDGELRHIHSSSSADQRNGGPGKRLGKVFACRFSLRAAPNGAHSLARGVLTRTESVLTATLWREKRLVKRNWTF